jgi:hypothetical protein
VHVADEGSLDEAQDLVSRFTMILGSDTEILVCTCAAPDAG